MIDQALLKKLVALRRAIHQYPELGNNEFRTAALVEKTLREFRIPYKRLTRTGVVGILQGKRSENRSGNRSGARSNGSSKCVALRADMDALPLTEKGSKPYRSKIPGVMHACGHDAHVAMLLGAAALLKDRDFSGTIKLMFQPNEEGAGGALQLIDKGVMKNPRVDAVFGLHVNPRFPVGSIGIKPGPLMASVDKFTVTITGRGGHAAYPHEGLDPLPIACEVVTALQTIVARKTDPVDSVVVTVGTIQGGTRYNILAESVTLTGTVRTLSEKTHAAVPRWIRQILDGVTKAHGATFTLDYEVLGSVLSNDPKMAERAMRVGTKLAGKDKVIALSSASMGGEDFAEYLKDAPGCFIYIGTGSASKSKLVPWHHPEFDLNETAMPVGSKLLAELARDFLNS